MEVQNQKDQRNFLIEFEENGYDLEKLKPYNDFLVECSQKNYLDLPTHKHHILPRFLKGTNCDFNLIKLSSVDHQQAHIILAKCFNENTRPYIGNMVSAFRLNHYTKSDIDFSAILSKIYTGNNNPMFGKPHPNRGKLISEEVKNILRIKVQERWADAVWVEKMMKLVYNNPEHGQKISIGQKLAWSRPEVIQRHQDAMTDEWRERRGLAIKMLWLDPVWRENRMKTVPSGILHPNFGKPGVFTGKSHTEETKKIMSESAKKTWTPERRLFHSKMLKETRQGQSVGFKNNNSYVIYDTNLNLYYFTKKMFFQNFSEFKMTETKYLNMIKAGRIIQMRKSEYNAITE